MEVFDVYIIFVERRKTLTLHELVKILGACCSRKILSGMIAFKPKRFTFSRFRRSLPKQFGDFLFPSCIDYLTLGEE